jgi:POT family proton-dependent oligopeptide transporter
MIPNAPVSPVNETSVQPGPAGKSKYLTAPVPTDKMPPGVPYIVGNEAAERFSFYGMRAILVVFMTKYLVGANGQPDHMSDVQAREWFHFFVASAYFFPLFGAIIADVFLGKYLTIISLSIVYCFGHLTLALNDTRLGLVIGLSLIAIGSGGIKPCVSSNVGDQFGATNQHLLSKVFSWFYFSINFGAAFSMFLIPILLDKCGPHVAFGTPGLLMLIATVIFWLGRKKFVHIPPSGGEFVRQAFSREGLKSISSQIVIFLFIAVFWSLYDQCSSAWVEQAEKMDLRLFGHEWLPSQVQTLNPLYILIYIPLFTYVIYPAINKIFPLTPLRKISIGFFIAAASFLVPAWVETQIHAGFKPTIAWHVLAYSLLIAAEIMVSITGLEFSYTQAPKAMKSMIMSFFLASVFVGNLFTALVNKFIQNPNGTSKLTGANYYLFFVAIMFIAAVAFIFVALGYREQTHIQDEHPMTVGVE